MSAPTVIMMNQNYWSRKMNNKLRILILCWEFPPNVVGGLSRHVNGLSVHLAQLGHEVHVITAGNGSLSEFEIYHGVKVHRVIPLNQQEDDFLTWIGGLNLAFVYQAEKLAEEISFDIIHTHDWLVGAAGIIIKDTNGIPLLSTIHATEHGRHNGIHTEMQQLIHEKELQLITESDQLIVCSDFMRGQLESIFHTDTKKIAVIANGIEPVNVIIEPEEFFPYIKNKKYVFSVGRIVKEKGFETIIDAAEMIKEAGIDICFIVAGKGPNLERYRQLTAERRLDHVVAFIGYITDEQRNALLLRSEMAVFPSLYEPFGIVALEAMVLGKPTIVSNTGGLKGIVKHLQTGLLMEPGDPQSLIENINYLLQNPQKREEIGQKGRKIVKSLYGWKRIATQTVQIMEDTLLNKKALGKK